MPGDGPEFEVEFSADVWYWRGPSPFHFVTVPAEPVSYTHLTLPTILRV